mmetsp:Transcript_26976/g.67708  ORF Transcript_26976/g.67708 Transcript_26976/m.67708 type:complete len:110 (+) Transcript_26976:60-389(+)|eukprot:CAMPEP_0174903052 /NCGR_PEP_ID=MMETSP0167-20121228/41805_1 /TAXON_ID=38298 /ORGANISM="Rhodella maculata, Strain CCMP736" /LENGTH=109 /DNA_ID=CAMNT_0016145263 /DNA_START=19 /DNA_END=348 /DNA_ORIENTATION=-
MTLLSPEAKLAAVAYAERLLRAADARIFQPLDSALDRANLLTPAATAVDFLLTRPVAAAAIGPLLLTVFFVILNWTFPRKKKRTEVEPPGAMSVLDGDAVVGMAAKKAQ